MGEQPNDAIESTVELLLDEAFRRGGTITRDTLLRIADRRKLDAVALAEVQRRLKAQEVEVEVETDEAAEAGSDAATTPNTEANDEEPSSTQVESVVGAYLRDASEYDLLSREEEVSTMRRIRAGEQAEAGLAAGQPDQSGELAALAVDGRLAREEFITANLRLVVHVAKQLARYSSLQLEDLIQEGNIGLMKALTKWDHTRGLKFSTYATWWIYQGITRASADKSRLVRIPVYVQTNATKVHRKLAALTRERGGVPPDAHTLSEHLGLPVHQVQFLLEMNREPLSIDAPVNDGETTIGESLPDQMGLNPEQVAANAQLSRDVQKALAELKEREATVLRRRLFGDETLEAIGDDFELTRERIRQIEAKALKRLKHPSKARWLAAHLDDEAEDDDAEAADEETN